MTVVATAGHVDHGKSTLVRALTGVDPDRLAEERERGLTIELGFAAATLPSGRTIEFVDVPGHVRFIRNMLSGVGSVDAVLFVVSAREGWKPQSEEHLRILELVGVDRGVVAITNIDRLDAAEADVAEAEVAAHLAGTFLERAPRLRVSVPADVGLPALTTALESLFAADRLADEPQRTRLWVDRVFAVRGAGTVVTGTLQGSGLAVGDTVDIVGGPAVNDHGPIRVRGLQHLGVDVPLLSGGHRCAVNLAGIAHTSIERGHALVPPGTWHQTDVIDASLRVLHGVGHALTRRGAFTVHIGSADVHASVRVLGADEIAPGATGAIRLRLDRALPLLPGDRFVLRESGRSETVGGGKLLDVAPRLPTTRARPDRSIERVVREHGWIEAPRLELLTGRRAPANIGTWVVDPDVLAAATENLIRRIRDAGPAGIPTAALSPRERAMLEAGPLDEPIEVHSGTVRAAAHAPEHDHPYLRDLQAAPLAPPPPPDDLDRVVLRQLAADGAAIRLGDVWFATTAIDLAIDRIDELLLLRPDGFTVSQAREHLGTSRKYALPLLGHLDSLGITRRNGDVRRAGPRRATRGQPR